MFAKFDENPAMTVQDIKKTKRYGRTHARTDNVKTVYPPPQTKFAGGIVNFSQGFSQKVVSTSCFVFKSLPTRGDFCCLLITFANGLDQDQARQNVRPNLDLNCLTPGLY